MIAMRESLIDMIRSGITTFADFREGGSHGVSLLLAAASGLPIRPIVLGRFAKVPFTAEEQEGNGALLTERMLEELAQFLSIANGFSSSTVNDPTDPAMGQVNDFASSRGKLKAIHVSETKESAEKSRARVGKSDVERAVTNLEPDFVVHMTNASDSDIDLIVRKRMPVVCCPRANAILAAGIPPLTKMASRGVTLGLGSDNVMLNQPDMFREMDYTARVIRAVEGDPSHPTCKDVLKMATVNGAKVLKMERDIGSIEVGKIADIVLIDGRDLNLRHSKDIVSSLVLRAAIHNVRIVLVAGRVVYERASG
jgi:cytosine/adenosine deaminase-related metal-dependent hydrolase